jgi:general secretion pathway protein A
MVSKLMAVYESYYRCAREPFSLNPDPGFLYASSSHREALAQLRYVVQERKGFAVVTGEVGTGKTMLLRSLIETASPKVQIGYIFNPPRTCRALYEAIADDLDIKLESLAHPVSELNRHLLQTFRAGGAVALIFDEAHDLPTEVLEEIRLLTNIETSRAKLLQVILAGQPELDAMLDTPELRALRQRVVFRYSLSPLSQADTMNYIASRLKDAGADRSPFTLSACEAVYRYSSGIPRLINVICDNAMLIGYANGSPIIQPGEIDEVAEDLRLNKAGKHIRGADTSGGVPSFGAAAWKRPLAIVVILAAALSIAALVRVAMANSDSSILVPWLGQLGRFFAQSVHWLLSGTAHVTADPSLLASSLCAARRFA